jgi:hypothetical protein
LRIGKKSPTGDAFQSTEDPAFFVFRGNILRGFCDERGSFALAAGLSISRRWRDGWRRQSQTSGEPADQAAVAAAQREWFWLSKPRKAGGE